LAHPKLKLGVIWIDAHADLHTPYTTPSGNVHGMPIAISLGEDNIESKVNKPDQETINYWYQLKNVGGICPKITPKDLVYINVRDTEKQEDYLMKKFGIKNFTTAEIRRKGVEKVAIEALSLIDHCDIIYVSFDVDCMDASISKGTGTPVPNGITEKEAGNLVARLMQSNKVCCFEMVEINPTLDKENLMAENAFEILLRATNQLIND
jgi:arginase